MSFSNINPDKGSVELANGCTLYWETNQVGGRTYFTDEIGGGAVVWDTSIISGNTLLCALSIEKSLETIERLRK